MWICSRYLSHSLMPLLGGRQLLQPILQAEQGPSLSSCSCWTWQSCAVHPCALLQAEQGPLKRQHFLLISCILGSSGHICSLEEGIRSQSFDPPFCCCGLCAWREGGV